MGFDFASKEDSDLFINLKGLCNKNQGFFKTAKQAQYLFDTYKKSFDSCHSVEQIKKYWGVDVTVDQAAVSVTMYSRWANYGTRSIVPVLYVFVLDKFGVVKLYKVGGNGNLRDGWAPNPDKSTCVWTRDESAIAPFVLPTEEEKALLKEQTPTSQYVGSIGSKVKLSATLVKERDLGYGQFGMMFISVFEDSDGNVINVWKKFDMNVGEKVYLTGTVKSQDEYKGTKQTTLIRAKLQDI